MKIALTTLAMLIVLSINAQSWRPTFVQYQPDGAGYQTTWDLVWNGDTIFHHMSYPNTTFQQYMTELYIPPGCIELIIYDSGGDGFATDSSNNGSFWWIWADTGLSIHHVTGNFGSELHYFMCDGDQEYPCFQSCTGDLNGDGIINVSDLNVLLSNYGSICD